MVIVRENCYLYIQRLAAARSGVSCRYLDVCLAETVSALSLNLCNAAVVCNLYKIGVKRLEGIIGRLIRIILSVEIEAHYSRRSYSLFENTLFNGYIVLVKCYKQVAADKLCVEIIRRYILIRKLTLVILTERPYITVLIGIRRVSAAYRGGHGENILCKLAAC